MEVNEWHRMRNLGPIHSAQLPDIGYIEPGVAAGFLYRTDSVYGLIDGFISNPLAPKVKAARALQAIAETILREVDRLKLRPLVIARAPSMGKLAMKLGGKSIGIYELFER